MAIRSANSQIVLEMDTVLEHVLTDSQTAQATIGASLISGSLSNGVSAGEASRAWENRGITISSGGSLDIDLYDLAGQDIGAGAGLDGLSLALALEEIVCLAIKQTSGPGRLEIMASSPAGALSWIPTGYLTVANGGALKSGGVAFWYESDESALNVTDGSSHMLRLGAISGNVAFDIYVLGRHDDNESSSSVNSSSCSTSSQSTSSVNSSSTSVNSSSSESSVNSSSSTSSVNSSSSTT